MFDPNNNPFGEHVGKELTPELEQYFESIGANIIPPGYGYTMDMNMTRLRVHTDAANLITRIAYG
jgi:hypothetical protein